MPELAFAVSPITPPAETALPDLPIPWNERRRHLRAIIARGKALIRRVATERSLQLHIVGDGNSAHEIRKAAERSEIINSRLPIAEEMIEYLHDPSVTIRRMAVKGLIASMSHFPDIPWSAIAWRTHLRHLGYDA